MVDLRGRIHAEEMMDDFSITDARLTEALENLRGVNHWLGGYSVMREALAPLVRRRHGQTIRLLDLGTGLADVPEALVRWADRQGVVLEVVGIEANEVTARYARQALDRRLPSRLRGRITVKVGDAFALPYEAGDFDVVSASLFLHHWKEEQAVTLLQVMRRLAREGVVISDLHRHPLGYYGILLVATLLPVSPMFAHDGPLSVRRGFTRDELDRMARAAGLVAYRIRWRWAFRWLLSSIS